jgi:hypothetical protein
LKNLHKNLPQQAQQSPKCCQNVVRKAKNKALFNVFVPLSKDQFSKRDFFDSFNGVRYPLVDGTRQRHFAGANFKPRKLPENAQTPTSRVHAVLARALFCGGLGFSLLPKRKNDCHNNLHDQVCGTID